MSEEAAFEVSRRSRITAVVLGVLYLAFWLWWGGSGEPLSEQAAAVYLGKLEALSAQSEHPNSKTLSAFRSLVGQDDGNEYYMVNLMKFRDKALYPPGYDYDDDAQAAAARYAAFVVPALVKRGSMPILMADVQGRFLDFDGADEWDQVAIVRYRSRRDMFEFALELGAKDQGVHKWASLEKTHVFPAEPVISLAMVRTLVACLLIGIGLALHVLFKALARRSARA
ncbi:MAG: hypothetical protein VX681_12955 [Myxococcota bacterium]|nr:hypothetical protein [Myxococcota bacterium]